MLVERKVNNCNNLQNLFDTESGLIFQLATLMPVGCGQQ